MDRRTFVKGGLGAFFGAGPVHIIKAAQRERPRRGRKMKPFKPIVGPSGEPFDWARTFGYPRPYNHGDTKGVGWPLLTEAGGSGDYFTNTIDYAVVNAWSRFCFVMLGIFPFCTYRRDVWQALHDANPGRHVDVWWHTHVQKLTDYGDHNAYWYDEWITCNGPPDANLWCMDGTSFPFNGTASADAHFVDTGLARAGLWNDLVNAGVLAGPADGFHIDYANSTLYGGSANGSPLDLSRTQWTTAAQLNASGKLGLDYLIDHLNAIGPCFPNGQGDADSIARWTGELFEGIGSNTTGCPIGRGWTNLDQMFTDSRVLRWVTADGMGGTAWFMGASQAVPYTADFNWKARLAGAISCMFGGYCCVSCDAFLPNSGPDGGTGRWADEYAVLDGVHDTTGVGRGWLGKPVEAPWKDGTSGIWVRRFDNGIVLLNPTTVSKTITLPATYKRIQGLRVPTINDGATVTSQTIPPINMPSAGGNSVDARFLLKV